MEREWLFDEEHRMFRESIRKWVAAEIAPYADEWEEKGEFPLELYRQAGELGFFGGGIPEAYGGVGGDFRYKVVFGEELARCRSGGVGAGLTLHEAIALPIVNAFGTEEQKQRYLVPGLRGEKIGALCVTEPNTGSDVGALQTRAVRDSDEFVITGSKMFITNGVRADFYIVACKTEREIGHRGISQILVEKGTPGFTVSRKLDKLGWRASDTAELSFDEVRVPVSNLMGTENQGFYQIMYGFQTERLIMAVGSVAAAQHCFEITLKYAKEREAFGRPIGSFQVNRHKFADMLTWIEAARRLVYHTVWLLINGLDCAKEVAMCKVFACEKAVQVADMCIQIHGGYGYMMEYDVQRIWRDQRIQPIGGGTSEIQKDIIGKLLDL
jgi:alkylation response protein AidB-like acyl-CoA dehydrogenase